MECRNHTRGQEYKSSESSSNAPVADGDKSNGGKSKRGITCYYCCKLGHYADEFVRMRNSTHLVQAHQLILFLPLTSETPNQPTMANEQVNH